MARWVGGVLLTAVAATAACLAAMFLLARQHGDVVSAEDLSGFGVLTFVITLAVAAANYTPAAVYARRHRWSRGKLAAATVLVMNLPVYGLLFVGMQRGMLAGPSEALLFAAAFVVGALVFSYMFKMDI